ncbi:MAG: hypothetical protein ABSG80_08975 [Verrucomicrobiota bacterium]|jgi:hypothetical protein
MGKLLTENESAPNDKRRQIRCRFLSLFVAPVFERIFSNGLVGGWCLLANEVSKAFISTPFHG